ncbi:MAG: SelB C-terminal domain-containing protein [Deltaproteobacteria bacterium]|nr:SelB C-terminal domain-containing protein [Deltaproteobacteria bacterium]
MRLLQALGVSRGVLVITKTDSPGARTEAVRAEAVAKMKAAFGRENSCVEISFECGLESFESALEDLLVTLPAPLDRGVPRLWIDRVFSVTGLGVVVTGTLREGRVERGQKLTLLPSEETVEVRGIQCYGEGVIEALPHQRVALQISGVKIEEIRRGDCLTGMPFEMTSVCDVSLDQAVRGAFSLSVGSWHGSARMIPVGESFYRLKCAPLSLRFGDPIVIRAPGGERTVATGRVRDPAPVPKHTEALERLRRITSVESFWESRLLGRGFATASDLMAGSAATKKDFDRWLAGQLQREGVILSRTQWEAGRESVKRLVAAGATLTQPSLEKTLDWAPQMVELLLKEMVQERIVERRPYGFVRPEVRAKTNPFTPRFREGLPLTRGALALSPAEIKKAVADGWLVSMGECVLDTQNYGRHKALVVAILQKSGAVTTSDLKTRLKMSRAQAVMILERLDRDRVTYLKDGVRRLLREV